MAMTVVFTPNQRGKPPDFAEIRWGASKLGDVELHFGDGDDLAGFKLTGFVLRRHSERIDVYLPNRLVFGAARSVAVLRPMTASWEGEPVWGLELEEGPLKERIIDGYHQWLTLHS